MKKGHTRIQVWPFFCSGDSSLDVGDGAEQGAVGTAVTSQNLIPARDDAHGVRRGIPTLEALAG